MKQLEKNIKKGYIYTLISSFDLTHGVWMLYLAHKGLTLFQIGIMETIFHITSFTMELPTGIIADIYGRKTSRTLGRLLSVLSVVIMIYGNSVFFFGISFILLAISYNLESGAGSALIYDSLKELGKEDTFLKVSGRNEVCYQVSRTLGLGIGGYIASTSFTNVYLGALVISLFSLLQSLTFKEPTIGQVERSHSFFKDFISQIKSSFRVIRDEKRVSQLILFFEGFSALYVTEFFYMQNKLKSSGYSEFYIGILLAIGALTAGVVASQTHRIEKKIKARGIVLISSILAIVAFWGMAVEGLDRFAFIILSAVEGLLFISFGDYINKLIPSTQRATILSMQSMVYSFFMIITFPIAGKIGDLYGLTTSFSIIAVIATFTLIFMIAKVGKRGSIAQ